jgi:hypothetical protein
MTSVVETHAARAAGKLLVRGRRAAVAANPFQLVGDQPVPAVDHHLLPERAGDPAG